MLADVCERGDELSGFIQQWEVLECNCKAEFCTIELVEGILLHGSTVLVGPWPPS